MRDSVVCVAVLAGSLWVGCTPDRPPEAPPPPAPPPVATAPAPPPPPPPPPLPGRKQRARVTEFKVDPINGLTLPGPVVFETGSDKLSPKSDEVLEVVRDFLDARPEVTLLRIEGHTEGEGKPEENQILSDKRAMAVARWLIALGVKCERLIPVGFGQTRPLTEAIDGKAQNGRIAFVPAEDHHRPIGGNPVDGGHKPAGDPCR